MSDFLRNNQTAVRTCMLYDALMRKPVYECYKNMCKLTENDDIDYVDFEIRFYRFYHGNHELDYDRSLDPEPLSFSELPIEVIVKVVDKLDFVSKLSIRKVSRNLQSVVDNRNFCYETVGLHVRGDNILLQFDKAFINYQETSNGCNIMWKGKTGKGIDYDGEDFINLAMCDLAVVIKNPKFQLKQLEVSITAEGVDVAEKCLKQVFNSSSKDRFHSKNIIMEVQKSSEVLSVMSCLKPGTLELVLLNMAVFDEEVMKEVVKLEQWKQAAGFYMLRTPFTLPVEDLFNFKSFVVYFPNITKEDINKIINILSKTTDFQYGRLKWKGEEDGLEAIANGQPAARRRIRAPKYVEFPIPDSDKIFQLRRQDESVIFGFIPNFE